LQLTAYGLVIWAMSFSAMAAVSALRETSVIFATIIGTRLLKERFGLLRISATMLVAGGVVVMNLAPA
jgi:drug/metabolite transporter (DMT)-like permease